MCVRKNRNPCIVHHTIYQQEQNCGLYITNWQYSQEVINRDLVDLEKKCLKQKKTFGISGKRQTVGVSKVFEIKMRSLVKCE